MSSAIDRAERALHQRLAMACRATKGAGAVDGMRAWQHTGLLAALATERELRFLTAVTGIEPDPDRLHAAIRFASTSLWRGVSPTLLLRGPADEQGESLLRAAGFARGTDRALAVRPLATHMPQRMWDAHGQGHGGDEPPEMTVVDAAANGEDFVRVLIEGYDVGGVVAAFIGVEHRLTELRRFLVVERGTPIAAGAMSVHGDVAVLGGASTLRAHRGKGAQTRLLRHRLDVAVALGCTAAVATVRPDTTSAANLARAGFTIHRRPAWQRG